MVKTAEVEILKQAENKFDVKVQGIKVASSLTYDDAVRYENTLKELNPYVEFRNKYYKDYSSKKYEITFVNQNDNDTPTEKIQRQENEITDLKMNLEAWKENSDSWQELAERYFKVLKEIVGFSKYEGNQWYENIKKVLKD